MHKTEYVVLVDSTDAEVGVEEKIKAHRDGLLHRAFSIFIYRYTERGLEFLLQERHPDKYHCGGLWTNACCSHPTLGEEVAIGARRRLQEELAIDLPLIKVGVFEYFAKFDNGLSEHELDHVFIAEYDELQTIVPDSKEIRSIQWIAVETLLEDLSIHSQRYTPWFKPALNLVLEELCYSL